MESEMGGPGVESEPVRKATEYCDEVEEIALQAAEMPEFINIVENSKGLARMKGVRQLLQDKFPEIKELPKPKGRTGTTMDRYMSGTFPGTSMSPPSNEFMIAKNIVELLKEQK